MVDFVSRRLPAAVIAAAAASVLLGASGGGASSASPRGKIVASGDDGLYVANIDGRGLRRVTSGTGDSDPEWSPDGRTIVFTRLAGPGATVEVLPTGSRTATPRRIGAEDIAGYPRWAPDGRRIAFAGCGGFCVVDPETGERHAIVADASFGFSWSPDGRRIVFGDGALTLADVIDGTETTIDVGAISGGVWRPSWSPDGSTIAFLGADTNDVYTVPANGGAVSTVVASGKVGASTPTWSPDGRRLAFVENDVIHVVTLASGRNVAVSDPHFVAADPVWTADGAALVYSRERVAGTQDPTDIWMTTLGGGSHAVTGPFPSGVGFDAPSFVAGSAPVGAVAKPRQLPLAIHPAADLALKRPVSLAAPAGDGIALETSDEFGACGPASIYTSALTSPTDSVETACGDADTIGALAAAPGLIAWTYCEETNAEDDCVLDARASGGGEQPLLFGDHHTGGDVGNLYGDGALVVVQSWRTRRAPSTLWRVVPGRTVKQQLRRLAEEPVGADVVDVEGGRIVIRHHDGRLTLLGLDKRGAALPAPTVRPGDGVYLSGRELVVQRGRRLLVYDIDTGRLLTRRQLAGGDSASVESIGGKLVAYTAGIVLHVLCLSNGHDHTVPLPGQGDLPHALFSRHGLYVAYNSMKPTPGRVLLIPLTQLGDCSTRVR